MELLDMREQKEGKVKVIREHEQAVDKQQNRIEALRLQIEQIRSREQRQ